MSHSRRSSSSTRIATDEAHWEGAVGSVQSKSKNLVTVTAHDTTRHGTTRSPAATSISISDWLTDWLTDYCCTRSAQIKTLSSSAYRLQTNVNVTFPCRFIPFRVRAWLTDVISSFSFSSFFFYVCCSIFRYLDNNNKSIEAAIEQESVSQSDRRTDRLLLSCRVQFHSRWRGVVQQPSVCSSIRLVLLV